MAKSLATFSSSSTRLLGRLAHLFDRDRIEIGEERFTGPAHCRIDHPTCA